MPLFLLAGLIAFASVYCVALFPYAYFRHDDWLVLGNALLRLPQNWNQAFKPTLFYANFEVPWFFRPFFKLLGWGFFQLFGYHYEGWLGALLALFAAAVVLTAYSVRRLTNSNAKLLLFSILFLAPCHFHFGSLVWAGEGLMNIPQLFFLALNLFFFVKGITAEAPKSRKIFLTLAWLAFLPSLGFKESSIFHPLFLPLVWFEWCGLREVSLKQRIHTLSPYASVLLVYLVFRLSMPWNPSYVAILKWQTMLRPALTIGASFALVLLGWMIAFGLSPLSALNILFCNLKLKYRWLHLPFLALVVAPYMGHGFFSVGWLLLPGFYFAFLLTLLLPDSTFELSPRRLFRLTVVVGICSFIPSYLFLSRIDWWQWNKPQHATKALLEKNGNRGYRKIIVFNCSNPRHPASDFTRVVAFNASLSFMWELFHQEKIDARIYGECVDDPHVRERFAGIPHTLYLRYRFPEITEVSLDEPTPSSTL